jgi:peptidoglycan/LPS O-acetylase OafA/YrhL
VVAAARQNDIPSLTGLRGVAACSVLLAHAWLSSFVWDGVPTFQTPAHRLSHFGMTLFFVLSGFVIEYNYAALFARQPLRTATYRFYVARVARLYPLYLFSLFLSMPIFPHPNLSVGRTLIYLTLTQSWVNEEYAAFSPDWSISTEWFFYLAFIPLTFLVARLRRPTVALVTMSVAGLIGLPLLFYFGHPSLAPVLEVVRRNPWIGAEPWGWFTYIAPYVRVFEFIVGVLAARCYLADRGGGPAPPAVRIAMAAALAWCAAIVVVTPLTDNALLYDVAENFLFAPAMAVVMLAVCRHETYLTRLLSSPLALFLGEISYSIYIWSFIAIGVAEGLLHHKETSFAAYGNAAMKVVLISALTIIFAYGSYHLIEVPSRRWIRAWGDRLARPNPRKDESALAQGGEIAEAAE